MNGLMHNTLLLDVLTGRESGIYQIRFFYEHGAGVSASIEVAGFE